MSVASDPGQVCCVSSFYIIILWICKSLFLWWFWDAICVASLLWCMHNLPYVSLFGWDNKVILNLESWGQVGMCVIWTTRKKRRQNGNRWRWRDGFCIGSETCEGWAARTKRMQNGGFSLACEDFGRMIDHSFPVCAFFFFLKWRLARVHYFRSLGQDQSTVAQRAETTVTECSLTSRVWARFLIGSHTMPGQQHSLSTLTLLLLLF